MFFRSIHPIVILVLLVCAGGAAAQVAADPFPEPVSSPNRPPRRDVPKGFKEMLAKQRAERDKRDHRQMLERGEEALRLATHLESAFANNKVLSAEDRTRLESLEKVVQKIREELGGNDDGGAEAVDLGEPGEARPSTVEEAFKYLQSTTVKLVDELKKTTRFTISAVAIQTSNNVLKLVKFLRLRK